MGGADAVRSAAGDRSAYAWRRITPDTGLRLSRALGLSERYWINMQTDYDIETEHDLHGEELRQVEVLVPTEAA